MSYARMGKESDVYVFRDKATGLFECCGCRLFTKRFALVETAADMRKHLLRHIQEGHRVPANALLRLKREASNA